MSRRRRSELTFEERLSAFTILAVAILVVAVARIFLKPSPSESTLSGFAWGVSFVGDLWPFALISLPLLALVWRHVLRQEASTLRTLDMRAKLGELTPDAFEDWCATNMRAAGYEVRRTGGQGDHGVDLLVDRDGASAVVQCKRYAGRRSVGEPQVRDLYGAMHHSAAQTAILITAGWFTAQATEWAKGKPIELWDVAHLASFAAPGAHRSVPDPVRTTPVCTTCGSPMVLRRNRRDGSSFYGCQRYPVCKFTRSLEARV
jgi:restriction system protein